MSYGHGIAVAPLQFAAATAALFNGGVRVQPTVLRGSTLPPAASAIITAETARQMARLFRLNVMTNDGTGQQAEAPGYRVGGKTGTADIASKGGYRNAEVISSFVAAFPMDKPEYVSLVLLFEPQVTDATGGKRTASVNAAPVTGRLIRRIAPLLNVAPLTVAATQ
jgi:cell division protein FtsI (penicillin-binding protein 3)